MVDGGHRRRRRIVRGDRALFGVERRVRDRAQRFGVPLCIERSRDLLVGKPACADQVLNPSAGRHAKQRGQQIRGCFQHHSPRSQIARSSARRFTKPGISRPRAVTHCGRPSSDSLIARHAPRRSPALKRFAVVLVQ
ncbi:hypothetical protein BG92_1941 [Burkholderia pseudomallei 406e]|nr:hypothetical protein DU27_3016 [Burkholderia pseudomallei]AJW90997.1 hypothetical protein BG92_1941 [Burkholderia pseudomallei 406e]CAJ3165719.1 Uncharacterised protein [Burkholderia pseudomallei]